MRGPRKAIDAAMLAAAIRVDGAVERNVRRIVARDDLARGIDSHARFERRQLIEALPSVIEGDPRKRLVAARRIRRSAASAPHLQIWRLGVETLHRCTANWRDFSGCEWAVIASFSGPWDDK